MGKRLPDHGADENGGPRGLKRARLDAPAPAKTIEIFSARQLQDLLSFRQDAVQQLRDGIQSFKVLLENVLYNQDDPNRSRQILILRDYLDSVKPKETTEQNGIFLEQLVQAWGFAGQTNNDHLASAISAILALLLRTLSSLIDLRDYCTLLCNTLLRQPQLKLVSRALSAQKQREHVISPVLRLLAEIVSFDGGALAKKVYDRREFTFDSKIVARNLSLVRAGEEEDRRKPSVRSNTVRYLLANFRYQAEGVKEDILKHANVVKALFDHIKDDSLDILQETLKVLETHVLRDDGITRSSKSHLLSERSLISIVGIIRTTSHANADSEVLEREGKRRSAALAFLKLIGSTPSLGVLRPSGWYPPGAERATDEEAEADEGDDELGLDLLPSSSQRFRGHIPVRNPILSGFIQNLRPHGSPEERELILAIFAAAPELVADYSLKKGDRFPFDPKLTNTWIGYASFVFSTVEQDIPPEFGAQGGTAIKPPPVSVVLENLLPLPLTQKALTRCLNQTSDLVTFFAVRILVLAVQKLQNILNFFNTNAGERAAALWKNAADQLVSEFSQRCPPIKDVIATSRKIPEENLVQREAIARLLRLYHLVLPQQALEEKFDVSASLVTALARAERTAGQEKKGLEMLELQHLLVIAQASAGMRWWHKQGALQYSPFVTLLRLCSASRDDTAIYTEFRKLLKSVVHEYGILCEGLKYESLDGLIASLAPSEFWTTENATYTFLDECLGRLVRKSVKYLDDLDQLRGNDNGKEVSLLVMACLEQVDFTTRLPEADRDDVVDWLFRFLKMLQLCGEACCDADLGMDGILYEHTNRDGPGCVTMDRIAGVFDKVVAAAQRTAPSESATVRLLHEGNVTQPSVVFRDPSTEKQDHPELYRWQQKDVEEAIDNGDVDGLVLCLCSAYEDVRLQALANVRKLIISIQASSYEEKDQIYLLLGELVETAKDVIHQRPLPYTAGAFAIRALKCLTDPTHFMYPKVNKYLNLGPVWNVSNLPAYWMEKTSLEAPDDDDAHWQELEWTLDLLADGLRSPQDVNILRTRNIFERILALYDAPGASKGLQQKALQILHRATCVGGATTLATRAGVLAWSQTQLAENDANGDALRVLAKGIGERVEQERVQQWSRGGFEDEMADIVAVR